MKNHRLKIFSLIALTMFVSLCTYAYQTVVIRFPEGEQWHKVYDGSTKRETIVQFVPVGETYQSWNRTIIFHCYKNYIDRNANQVLRPLLTRLEQLNGSQRYVYLKTGYDDSIATRCVYKNANMKAQCDIYRATKAPEGMITMQYINKNVADFKNSYNQWYDLMKDAKVYYSHFRQDRVMSKGTSFEL